MATYDFTGETQFVTITQDGVYDIEVAGAQGGAAFKGEGGLGATISGKFSLTEGTRLAIVVGEQGESGVIRSGGGGASWVFIIEEDGSYTPLIIGGGGGGSGADVRGGGSSGLGGDGSGGDDGLSPNHGGGGAGFLGNGEVFLSREGNRPEVKPFGGHGGFNQSGNFSGGKFGAADGGFGGGGSAPGTSISASGGGGGYTGGDAQSGDRSPSTGGTSYVAPSGSEIDLRGSSHQGNGQISITGGRDAALVSSTHAIYDTTESSDVRGFTGQAAGDTFGYSFTTQGTAVLLTSVAFGVFDPGGGSGSIEISLRANGTNDIPGAMLASLGVISSDAVEDGKGVPLVARDLAYVLQPNTTYWIIGQNSSASKLQAAVSFDNDGIGSAYDYGRFYSEKTDSSRSFLNNDTYNGTSGFAGAQFGEVNVVNFTHHYLKVTNDTIYDPLKAVGVGLTVVSDPSHYYEVTISETTLTVSDGTFNDRFSLAGGPKSLQMDFSSNTGAVNLNGWDYGDVLRGGSGEDALKGGGGSDILEGGAGRDLLNGGEGINTLSYEHSVGGVTIDLRDSSASGGDAEGDLLAEGSFHNIVGGLGNDMLTGDGNANRLSGGAGVDGLKGVGGSDILDGGAGGDTLIGKDLNAPDTAPDTVTYANSSAGVTVDLNLGFTAQTSAGDAGGDTLIAIDNLVGSAFADSLTGDGGANVLRGGEGDDTLVGNGGDDRLVGGEGVDRMTGGAGNDEFFVDSAGDKVIEAAGGGTDTVYASVSYRLTSGQEIEVLRAQSSTGVSLTGNAGANRIVGDVGNDMLDGGAGIDRLFGGQGDDIYYVDDARDTVTEAAGAGTDTVYASVSYTLAAGQEIESLRVRGSAGLSLTGNEGDNRIIGGAGNDTLDGGAGADKLFGGLGDDTYLVDSARDVVTEAADAGNDTVITSVSFTLKTGQSIETLRASGTSGLSLTGNEGDTAIVGGGGRDVIAGGLGRDTLTGGAEADTFAFRTLADSSSGIAKRDVILDFQAGSDRIDLSAIQAVLGAPTDQAFSFIGSAAFSGTAGELHAIKSGASTIIEGDTDGNGRADFQIALKDMLATLQAGDFIL